MKSVTEWLESLGLGEYSQRFAESAIDPSVLPDLTDQDLKELGVLLGHRRRLLRAIAELNVASLRPPHSGGESLRRDDAERRQITMMFCDLVGSTALAARLDPEDMRAVMGAYHTCLAKVIREHEGIVAQYLGDGVLAHFGFPHAHEDDAVQAVRAGLAVVDAVADLKTDAGAQLRVRVGIATGTVVAGDLPGEGSDEDRAVVGETPNLAARLQALAEPGTVVICAGTRRLTRGHFEYRDFGPVALRGIAEAIPVWQVLGPSGVESRFEAEHDRRLAPLLGRDEQIGLLLRRWRDARLGEGRVVLLTGEPGIGKSHIALALQEALQVEAHIGLRYFCSAHHANSALFPFISHLERSAHFERGNSPKEKLDKLAALLARSGLHSRDALSVLASLLSLPSNGRHPPLELNPQTRKQMTLAALLTQLDGLATRHTLLIIVEDVHWIDPTSLELLTLLVERVPTRPVLLVMTARPEFTAPWPSHAHVSTVALTRLGRHDAAALVKGVSGGKSLPDEVMNQILDRAGGVPLFVEELTKTVLESGLLQQRVSDYVLDRPLPPLAIPMTLHASLVARLDRLAQAKEIAQIGAVLGREFSYELLYAIAGLSGEQLQTALDELVGSRLMFCRGEPPEAVYTFKHALVRDAAYAGLLKTRRVQLHAAIANTFEQKFPEIVAVQPETLADHLTEAGLTKRAVEYWLQAGKKAAMRSANLEAVAHLHRGIDAARSLPDSPGRDKMELDLQFTLAPCVIATDGAASRRAVATFERARELCELLGDPPEYLQVMFWIATASVVRGELPQALEADLAVLRRAEAHGDEPARLNAMRGQAMILLFMGRVVESREVVERALEAFNAADESQKRAAGAAGQDCGVASLALMSWASWLLGYVDSAAVQAKAAIGRADASEHAHTRAYAYYYASVVHALRGEPALAQRHAERCLTLSEEHGFRHWRGLSHAVRGICRTMLDPSPSSLDEVTVALDEYRGAGYQLGITALYVLLCPALLLHHRPEAALEVIEQGLAMVRQNSERLFEAELYRLKARALLAAGASQTAGEIEAWLGRALATARDQHSRSLELRAANDLAALWIDRGRGGEARDLLAPIHAWFTEGSDTPDLKQARVLLDRVS